MERSVLRLVRAGWSKRLPPDEPLFEEPLDEPLDDLARAVAPTGWFDWFPLFEAGRDAASIRRSDLAALLEAPLLAAPFLRRLFCPLF